MFAKCFFRPQVLVYGGQRGWLRALGPKGRIWSQLAQAFEVVRGYHLGLLPTWRKRYVIPSVRSGTCTGCRSPPGFSVRAAKARSRPCRQTLLCAFRRGVWPRAALPRRPTIRRRARHFPAVLKRIDLNGGTGVSPGAQRRRAGRAAEASRSGASFQPCCRRYDPRRARRDAARGGGRPGASCGIASTPMISIPSLGYGRHRRQPVPRSGAISAEDLADSRALPAAACL